jgi:hypothetical protein
MLSQTNINQAEKYFKKSNWTWISWIWIGCSQIKSRRSSNDTSKKLEATTYWTKLKIRQTKYVERTNCDDERTNEENIVPTIFK